MTKTQTRPLSITGLLSSSPGGWLDKIAIPPALRLLSRSTRTGCLRVYGVNHQLSIFVQGGKLNYVQLSDKRHEMLAVVLGCPALARLRNDSLLAEAAKRPGVDFALDLMSRYNLDHANIAAPLDRFYQDTMMLALFWTGARIAFLIGEIAPENIAPATQTDLAAIADAMDEFQVQADAFTSSLSPHGKMAIPYLTKNPPKNRIKRLPGYYERQAMAWIDGKRTIGLIAAYMGFGRPETFAILSSLYNGGWIELNDPDGQPLLRQKYNPLENQ